MIMTTKAGQPGQIVSIRAILMIFFSHGKADIPFPLSYGDILSSAPWSTFTTKSSGDVVGQDLKHLQASTIIGTASDRDVQVYSSDG